MDREPTPSNDTALENSFATVVALRRKADDLERRTVSAALGQGWSWADIAQSLGVSKQAAHKRLSGTVSRTDT